MAKKRRSVFAKPIRATPTYLDGVRYDSKAEAERAYVLKACKREGRALHVFRQVKADVGDPRTSRPYRVDFLALWLQSDGSIAAVAEDVKGADSPTFRRHIKEWRIRGGIDLAVIRNGKREETITGGMEPPMWDKIKWPRKALAARAVEHMGAIESGRTLAAFRAVDMHIPGLPPVDFLIIENGDWEQVPVAEIVLRAQSDFDTLSPAMRDLWLRWRIAAPIPLRVICGDREMGVYPRSHPESHPFPAGLFARDFQP